MARDLIDLIVITESKRWDDTWNTRLSGPQFQLGIINCTRHSPTGSDRGGVVIMYRMPVLTIDHVTLHSNTMITCEVTFDNNGHSQMFNLIGIYINPAPNDDERQSIEKWKKITKECIAHSTSPILVMGDLNTEGREFLHQKLLRIAPIDDYIGDSPTFVVPNTQKTRSLDGVFARNLPQAKI